MPFRTHSVVWPLLAVGCAACSSYRPIAAPNVVTEAQVDLQSANGFSVDMTTRDGMAIRCTATHLRGTVRERMGDSIMLSNARILAAPTLPSHECRTARDARLALDEARDLDVSRRRLSFARTFGMLFGVYLAGGLLIASMMVGGL